MRSRDLFHEQQHGPRTRRYGHDPKPKPKPAKLRPRPRRRIDDVDELRPFEREITARALASLEAAESRRPPDFAPRSDAAEVAAAEAEAARRLPPPPPAGPRSDAAAVAAAEFERDRRREAAVKSGDARAPLAKSSEHRARRRR